MAPVPKGGKVLKFHIDLACILRTFTFTINLQQISPEHLPFLKASSLLWLKKILSHHIARTEKYHPRSERKAKYYSTVSKVPPPRSCIMHLRSISSGVPNPPRTFSSSGFVPKSKPQSRFQSPKITTTSTSNPNSRVPSQEFGYRYLFQYRTLIATIHILFIYISTSTS
jgi:hypothetical protein